jgi:hypothetical protein
MLFQGPQNFQKIKEKPPNSSNFRSDCQSTNLLVAKFKKTKIYTIYQSLSGQIQGSYNLHNLQIS